MNDLPPILRTPGLRVVDWGVTPQGYPFLRLAQTNRARRGPIRSVIVYLMCDRPGYWLFAYSYIDNETNVLVSKHGRAGDPELDEDGDWYGM